jgi:hypothetical protein
VRGAVNKEPWSRLWEGVLAKSERVRRGRLDPKMAFGGVGGQRVRFTMTEGLECVALHALVGKDAAAAKALSDFFEAWDPAPLEKDIAETDFMSSGEFFEGLAVVLDWTWDLLAESARAKLRAIVERRARHNYDGFVGKKSWEAVIEANNHSMASMGALGLAAIALWHENPDASLWAGLTHAKMKAYLATSFDPDGACYEGTMYGPFGLFRILPFSDCCARFGAGDAMAHGFLDRVMNQLVNELTPGCDRMLPINDTDGLAPDRATHVSGEAALDIVPCLLDNGGVAFETKRFPSANFGDHPMLRATFKGNRWLGLTVLAPRKLAETAADVKREIKGGELFVTVARGGATDELMVTAAPNGGIAALRVIRAADGKTVTENLKVK